jgi:hypothetical protein
MIRWRRLVLVIRFKSLKTSSRDYQARVHSDQLVLMIARWEASPCEQSPKPRATFSEDTQMRVGKQLLTAKNLIRKQEECQPKQESPYSFSWGSDEGGVVVDEDDNDE